MSWPRITGGRFRQASLLSVMRCGNVSFDADQKADPTATETGRHDRKAIDRNRRVSPAVSVTAPSVVSAARPGP